MVKDTIYVEISISKKRIMDLLSSPLTIMRLKNYEYSRLADEILNLITEEIRRSYNERR